VAVHVSVGCVLTPVAPVAGLGELGNPGGDAPTVPEVDTLSNAAVATCEVSWLDTASPTYTLGPMVNDADPICRHVVPSADWNPVIVLPERTILTHSGAAVAVPATLAADAPVESR
jgi:hypothetical protein